MSLKDIKVTEREEDGETIYRYEPQTRRGGKWVRFGLEEFRLAALGLLEVQELQEDVDGLREIKGSPTTEQWKMSHRIIWASMRRNYPTIEVNDVTPLVDLDNFADVLGAVLGVSGYVRRPAQPGEPQPSQ